MNKLSMVLGIALMMIVITPYAQAVPYYIFGMAGRGFIYTNSSVTTTMRINAFHGSSETWKLFLEKSGNDQFPYDNFTLNIDCTSGDSASIITTDYTSWVDYGYIDIPLTYEDESVIINYNSVPLSTKTVECDFVMTYVNQTNNTYPYVRRWIQMIPYYASIEFVECTGFEDENFGMQFTGQLTGVITMMEDAWDIAWIIYSISIIVFAVIGIPILVFIIMRWAIYRITGHKLIERRER